MTPDPDSALPAESAPQPYAHPGGPPRRAGLRRSVLWGVALGLVLGLGAFGVKWWADWNRLGPTEARGGAYFPKRVELSVPLFRQNDTRWGKEPLGPSTDTLGSAGCAVTSTAMVLASYGLETDPQRLNTFLSEHEGYTPQGWLYWEKAAELAPEQVRHVYEDAPSHRLIDTNLMHGNPVIVRLRYPGGTTHFVVIAGKDGFDYLTRDPGRGASKGLYPLKEFGSKIEALRFYERVKPQS